MKRALKITMTMALLLISAVVMSGCATMGNETMNDSMMSSKETMHKDDMHKPMSDTMATGHGDMMEKDSGMTDTMK